MRDNSERVLDMMEAIERIERYSQKGPDVFKSDELIQTWVVYHLQIIGEAASKLGHVFHDTYPEIPWPQIIAMRNLLAHEYFGIDLDEVWQVVERDLPMLEKRLNRIREDLS
jgi:uncharacterized protein with HEPN domain